jgi:hypothetical protein
MLTAPTLTTLDVAKAGDLAAIAFRLTRATGFYRAPSNGPMVFMTFGAGPARGTAIDAVRVYAAVGDGMVAAN